MNKKHRRKRKPFATRPRKSTKTNSLGFDRIHYIFHKSELVEGVINLYTICMNEKSFCTFKNPRQIKLFQQVYQLEQIFLLFCVAL